MVRPSQIGQTGSPTNHSDITYECNQNKPRIENFILTPSEKVAKEKLLVDLHLAVLLKHLNQSQGDSFPIYLPLQPSFTV